MYEFVPVFLTVVVGFAIAVLQAHRFGRALGQLLIASYAAHILSALAQVWLVRYVYGGGDILGYAWMGMPLASGLRDDFPRFAPEVFKLFAHQPAALPTDIPGQGSSTGSMAALAGLIIYATGGDAYTLCCVVAVAAYFGNVALFTAFRDAFPAAYHRRVLMAATLIPSAVFWSSGFLKEGVAVAALGFLVLSLHRLMRKPRPEQIATGLAAAGIIGLLKPYILAGVIAGAAAYIFFRSPERRNFFSKPASIAGGIVVAIGGAALLLKLFPNYSLEALSEQAAYYQEMGQVVPGGSTYAIGDFSDKSGLQQLIYLPVALFTSLFRPLLFEARNPLVFVNALETTTLIVLFFRSLSRRKLKDTIGMLYTYPMLAFSAGFVLVFAVGVGFMTTNLGTLSRYRMPLVPFLWAFVLVLGAPEQSTTPARPAPFPARRRQARSTAVSTGITG